MAKKLSCLFERMTKKWGQSKEVAPQLIWLPKIKVASSLSYLRASWRCFKQEAVSRLTTALHEEFLYRLVQHLFLVFLERRKRNSVAFSSKNQFIAIVKSRIKSFKRLWVTKGTKLEKVVKKNDIKVPFRKASAGS